jgi:hypothetical protein
MEGMSEAEFLRDQRFKTWLLVGWACLLVFHLFWLWRVPIDLDSLGLSRLNGDGRQAGGIKPR